jgi:hypothetical protein
MFLETLIQNKIENHRRKSQLGCFQISFNNIKTKRSVIQKCTFFAAAKQTEKTFKLNQF